MKHTQREKQRAKRTLHNHCRYTAGRLQLLHQGHESVFVGGRLSALLPPPADEEKIGDRAFCHSAHTHTHTHTRARAHTHTHTHAHAKKHPHTHTEKKKKQQHQNHTKIPPTSNWLDSGLPGGRRYRLVLLEVVTLPQPLALLEAPKGYTEELFSRGSNASRSSRFERLE